MCPLQNPTCENHTEHTDTECRGRRLLGSLSIASYNSLLNKKYKKIWVDMLIFYILLFGLVYLAWWDFAMDLTKEQHQMLCKSWKKCNTDVFQWLDKRLGRKHEPYAGAWMTCSFQGRPWRMRQVNKVKSMLIIFFGIKAIVHKEFVLVDQTVNSTCYSDVFWRLRENVRRLCPELWRQNSPSHTSFLTMGFVTKKKISVIPHPSFLLFSVFRLNIYYKKNYLSVN
jgi:hypothetical protein